MNDASNDSTNKTSVPTAMDSSIDGSISFDVLKEIIPLSSYLDPNHSATRTAFLDKNNKDQQKKLLLLLTAWETILKSTDDPSEMADNAVIESTHVGNCFNDNLASIISENKELEQSYHAVANFFENATAAPDNISILNATLSQATDTDNTIFIDAVAKELNDNFDRLDLSENYSLLAVPGFLGTAKTIEKWAKIAYNNKVLLITDYRHLDEPDDVVALFEESYISGIEPFRSNTIMTCNWLVGRGRYDILSEQDDLYVPPSTALAGTIYSGLLSQVSAGASFGKLYGAKGVRFKLKKGDLAAIEELGLIPILYEHGTTIAYSSKTLFTGDNLGLQTYSVVRVFDYVTKVLMDFLNRRTFENFNAKTRKEVMTEIVFFLDKIAGPGKLIDSFTINRFEQDLKDKNKIHLDVRMEPYFPAKNFLLKMNFETGSEAKKWNTAYEQDD